MKKLLRAFVFSFFLASWGTQALASPWASNKNYFSKTGGKFIF
jgi:hypothetical protein